MAITKLEVTEEIERLHAFISSWFRGEQGNDEATFSAGFSSVLSGAFVNIQPSGQILTKADLLDPIKEAFGRNPDFFITVSDVEVRNIFAENYCLATYLEFQEGAKNTKPSNNYRRSTVFFEKRDEALIWHHIHETAV